MTADGKNTMRAWSIKQSPSSAAELVIVQQEKPVPAENEVLIRVRACSLNYRDQLLLRGGDLAGTLTQDCTPLSDGTGEVEAVGSGVSKFRPGDRVAGTFIQVWTDGSAKGKLRKALGAPPFQGMLSEYVALPEEGVIHIAKSLTFEEAATLPCAGITAWNALMEGPCRVGPGRTVLTLGTGGVSLIALQLAKSAGAKVIVTSSSDEKLARARELGADLAINYRTTPQWGVEADRLSDSGIDHVIETGGLGTLAQSMMAVGFGGEIALVGVMTERGDKDFDVYQLLLKNANLRGVSVGSTAMAIALNRAIDANGVKPVIDRRFSFDEAREAWAYQSSAGLFGKVVITV